MSKDKETKRPTAREYAQEMQDLLNKAEKLKMVIVTRLYTLCSLYPEAPIAIQANIENTIIKAKTLIPENRSKGVIKDLPFSTQIKFIDTIEKWLANQHPHKQLGIAFKEKFDVLNQS